MRPASLIPRHFLVVVILRAGRLKSGLRAQTAVCRRTPASRCVRSGPRFAPLRGACSGSQAISLPLRRAVAAVDRLGGFADIGLMRLGGLDVARLMHRAGLAAARCRACRACDACRVLDHLWPAWSSRLAAAGVTLTWRRPARSCGGRRGTGSARGLLRRKPGRRSAWSRSARRRISSTWCSPFCLRRRFERLRRFRNTCLNPAR